MKKLVILFVVLIVSVALVLPLSAKPITLKLGHVTSAVEPIHQAFEFYAKSVAERTNGEVKIEVYPSAAL